jgi:hypothetical protein
MGRASKKKGFLYNITYNGQILRRNSISKSSVEGEQVTAVVSDTLSKLIAPFLDGDFLNINIEEMSKKLSLLKNQPTFKDTVGGTISSVQKSVNISNENTTLKEQLEQVADYKETVQNYNEDAIKGDMNIVIESNVTLDMNPAYLLYQHFFGFPDGGIWDPEKLNMIMEVLANDIPDEEKKSEEFDPISDVTQTTTNDGDVINQMTVNLVDKAVSTAINNIMDNT